MSPLSQQERRWIREGIEATRKLVQVTKMSLPVGLEDREDEEAFRLVCDIEDKARQLESMIDWEAKA